MNGIYLCLLLREIGEELVGKHVEDIGVRDRTVRLLLNGHSLCISLYPKALGLFLSAKHMRGYETMKPMRDIAKSSRIIKIVQYNMMPVVSLMLQKPFPKEEDLEIVVSLYPEAPNFSLVTQSWQRNLFSRYIKKDSKASILELGENDVAGSGPEDLVRNIEGIDKKLAQELNPEHLQEIKAIVQGKRARPRLISTEPLYISLFAPKFVKEYSSFNDLLEIAITDFVRGRERQTIEQQQRVVSRNIRKRIARLRRKSLRPEDIERLRTAGEMILANINEVKKGSSSVKLVDPYTQKQIAIELDPHLTPQGNAQRYFSRYKKAKRGQPRLKEQIAALTKELNASESKSHGEKPTEKRVSEAVPSKEPFLRFVLESGSIVLAGKSARSNDELTFKHARPGDYFFHTRGFEGAHIILRPNIPRGQRPSKEEIRIAAAIAAYFSKAKKQQNVAVSYTQRKYLKKNKKGKIGSVILMREDVVFVDPGLPT